MEKTLDAIENPPEAASAQPPAAPTVESQLVELAKSDDSLKHRIIDRYFGSDDKESSIVGDILKNPQEALQFVGGALGLIAQTFGVRPQQQQQNGQTQQPPPDPVLLMLEPMRPLIEALCVELVNDSDTEAALALIEAAKQQNPALESYLSFIAEMSSVEVINTLARFTGNRILLKLKHGAEWVENLQSALRGEKGEEDEGESEDFPGTLGGE